MFEKTLTIISSYQTIFHSAYHKIFQSISTIRM